MPTINRSILLNVPVEVAFDYLKQTDHLTELCMNLLEIKPTTDSPRFDWSFRMAGARYVGAGQVKSVMYGRHLKLRFWGGINGEIDWYFQSTESGCRVEANVDYAIPTPLARGRQAEPVIAANECDAVALLNTLKRILEPESEVSP